MCGYANYQDPRLQPSEVGDDEITPTECWELCTHGMACMGLLMRLNGGGMTSTEKAVQVMGCADCDEWEVV